MAWEPDRRYNVFFSPPAHLCAVTCMTEISLIVTLNNKFNQSKSYPRTFRPRNRLMNLPGHDFSLKADFHVWFPYRFNFNFNVYLYDNSMTLFQGQSYRRTRHQRLHRHRRGYTPWGLWPIHTYLQGMAWHVPRWAAILEEVCHPPVPGSALRARMACSTGIEGSVRITVEHEEAAM